MIPPIDKKIHTLFKNKLPRRTTNRTEMSSFEDKTRGKFLEIGPAIKLNMSLKKYEDLSTTEDWGFHIDSSYSPISHEIAHFFQLLGSSYGYLIHQARRWRQKAFYEMFQEVVNSKPDIKINRPCIDFFMDQSNNIKYQNNSNVMYVATDLLVNFLYDYDGQNAKHFVDMINGYFLLCSRFEFYMFDDYAIIERLFSNTLTLPPEAAECDFALAQDGYRGFLTPRSIVEGYARFTEFYSMKWFRNLEFYEHFGASAKQIQKQLGAHYGYVFNIILDVLRERFDQQYILEVLVSIVEFSLMTTLHPALIRDEISDVRELFITSRLNVILNYIRNNDKDVIDLFRNFVDQKREDLFNLLDGLCDILNWQKYSSCIDKLIKFYDGMIAKTKNNPSEWLFYITSKRILELKRKHNMLPFNNCQELFAKSELEKIPVIILLDDGLSINSGFSQDKDQAFEYIFPSFLEILNEITNLEIMGTNNYKVTEKYLNIAGGDVSLNSYLKGHKYYTNINH